MNKKNILLSIAFIFGGISPLFAQEVIDNDEENEYDDEEIIIDKENGDEEIIEVPEGMLIEIDPS